MISISIIGPGRLGGALALALPRTKYRIENLIGRSHMKLDARDGFPTEITALTDVNFIGSDVVFITTDDGSILDVSKALVGKLNIGSYVFHASGALTSSIMENLAESGCYVGSIHPLVSISRAELGPSRFPGAYFCVEGDEKAVKFAEILVGHLGGKPFKIATKFKTLYHAAAVMACGHLIAMFDSAVEVLTKCGLSQEDSKQILLPLTVSTVENLSQQSTSSALTGTFGRADIETFTRHLTALNEKVSDDLLEIYLLLGERSLELASKEGVNPERIDNLRVRMAVAKTRLKW